MFLGDMRKHIKTVMTHRKWVREYCFKAGLYWQGLTHDLSKYSPVEFFESVKYYQGTSSPIDACKKEKGYSRAWLHHRGRNKHHREYWTDYYDQGCYSLIMPYKYAAEMVCDFLGAGRAYSGDKFTFSAEYDWWVAQLKRNICIHPAIACFVSCVLIECREANCADKVLANLPAYYEDAINWWHDNFDNGHGGTYCNCNSLTYLDYII